MVAFGVGSNFTATASGIPNPSFRVACLLATIPGFAVVEVPGRWRR